MRLGTQIELQAAAKIVDVARKELEAGGPGSGRKPGFAQLAQTANQFSALAKSASSIAGPTQHDDYMKLGSKQAHKDAYKAHTKAANAHFAAELAAPQGMDREMHHERGMLHNDRADKHYEAMHYARKP